MWIDAHLDSIKKETESTWRFFIKISDKNFSLIAGQFIQVKIDDIVRSYSVASLIDNKNVIELIIVKLDGGKMTNYLFNKIKIGKSFKIKGPLGKFILPEKIDRDIFFISTGTGIAPFRSMLQYIEKNKIKHLNIFIIFGTRSKKDILYYDEMIKLSSKQNIIYIPTLSREKWSGNNGYVHSIYEKILNDEEGLINPLFYLCGWRDMIKEARSKLKNLGIDSKSIKLEIYG